MKMKYQNLDPKKEDDLVKLSTDLDQKAERLYRMYQEFISEIIKRIKL